MAALRTVALDVIESGLEAIDPLSAVARTVKLDGTTLKVAGRRYELDAVRHVIVLGAGKASLRVAEGVEAVLGDRISKGVVVVRRGQERPLQRIKVLASDHPLPSEASVEAARQLLTLADEAGADDLIISAVTGGSSALACYPPEGVTLVEVRDLHRRLLGCGATIEEINTVRKHVSQIKGGRLARRAAPARIINLTVSDVAGDSPEYITDLTVQNSTSVEDARDVLNRHRLWDEIAPSIREHLRHPERAQLPDVSDVDIHTVMMVTGETACVAMSQRARKAGYEPVVLSTTLEGESREVGRLLAGLARECMRKARPFRPPCVLIGCGGETTVTLRLESDVFGTGGPNQEAALASAIRFERDDLVAAVYIDTDGSDGGTAFAGALVDGLSSSRAKKSRIDLRDALLAHRSSTVLKQLDDLWSRARHRPT